MRTFLLALSALLVTVGAVEIALRVTHAFGARISSAQPDPWIAWRYTPGREFWSFKENDHAITTRINSMGWCDRERTRARPTDTRRAAVLGDSYVEALQVELDSTFVAIAERELSRSGERYEVMNFGRSGMGAAEERLVLESDVLPCDPQVVVLFFTPHNDVADASPVSATTPLRPFYSVDGRNSLVLDVSFNQSRGYRIREWLNPLKQRSALVSLVAERINAARVNAPRGEPAQAARLSGVHTLLTAHPDSLMLANYALTKRLMAEMARLCAANGVAFMVMSVPLVYEDDDVAELRAIDPTLDPNFFDRDLAELADSTGFGFVPLTGRFSEAYRRTRQPLCWVHLNYRGHRLMGELLVEALEAPSPPPPAGHNR
jgi:hypothetical protein